MMNCLKTSVICGLGLLVVMAAGPGCAQEKKGAEPTDEVATMPTEMAVVELKPSTVTNFGILVLESFQANEVDRFTATAWPSKAEMIAIFTAMEPERFDERARNEIERGYERAEREQREGWQRVYDAGVEKGIDWSKVRFVRAALESPKHDQYESGKPDEIDIDIYFEHAGVAHRIQLDDCLYYEKKWYAIDEPFWPEP